MTESNQRADSTSVRLDLSPSEAQLLTTALKLLESTLGREEAEELEEVKALLEKLRSAQAA